MCCRAADEPKIDAFLTEVIMPAVSVVAPVERLRALEPDQTDAGMRVRQRLR